jgi:hypothetical protein
MSKVKQGLANDHSRDAATRAKRSKSLKELLNDPVRGTALKAKRSHTRKINSNKRIRTKWRHAMKDPLFVAYRKKVEAMGLEGRNFQHIDRLQKIDEIDQTGTLEQKEMCLTTVICKRGSGILPHFYSPLGQRRS